MGSQQGSVLRSRAAIAFGAAVLGLSRAPTRPLAERLSQAETVFVGTVTNRIADGDWARADLPVEEPLLRAERGGNVRVIWRVTLRGTPIYDTAAGARAIAMLKDKHEARKPPSDARSAERRPS